MTASTPRIPRHRPLFESACHGDCRQGRDCTCSEPANMGCTLGIEQAMSDERQPMTKRDARTVAFIYGMSAAAVFSALYMLA